MLNWFTHNTYLEIPMTQRMALYFDSRAEKSVADSISSVGQTLTGAAGAMGMGGIIGGMVGGPLGAVFGAAMGKAGSSLLGNFLGRAAGFFGSIIGASYVEKERLWKLSKVLGEFLDV